MILFFMKDVKFVKWLHYTCWIQSNIKAILIIMPSGIMKEKEEEKKGEEYTMRNLMIFLMTISMTFK